jgi:SAM-dependent methyltransferase
VDATVASWYAPGQASTGSVWDALVAPLLWLPRARRRSVLILGLGGGSAARLVRAIAPRARIVGVERDAAVLRASRRWFDLDRLGVEVVEDDAQRYLRRSRRRFDAVLDDVFVGRGRRVRKPEWLPRPGLELAARRVGHGGLLVSNALDEAGAVIRAMREIYPSSLRIELDGFDNRVIVGGPATLEARGLRAAAAREPLLAPVLGRLAVRTLPAGRLSLPAPADVSRGRRGTAARSG